MDIYSFDWYILYFFFFKFRNTSQNHVLNVCEYHIRNLTLQCLLSILCNFCFCRFGICFCYIEILFPKKCQFTIFERYVFRKSEKFTRSLVFPRKTSFLKKLLKKILSKDSKISQIFILKFQLRIYRNNSLPILSK